MPRHACQILRRLTVPCRDRGIHLLRYWSRGGGCYRTGSGGVGGQVRFYPYTKVLAMPKAGGGGTTSFKVVFTQ